MAYDVLTENLPPIVRLIDVTKVYGKDEAEVIALNNVTVDIRKSELTAIMGESGSGKSTLLHILAGLDTATRGTVLVEDTDITALDDKKLTELRRDRIGFVFQSFNLVPTLTAEQNIVLPLDLANKKVDRDKFNSIVRTLGIENRLAHRPSELSGGQQQRVAIARALITSPAIIVADEPTGSLDSHSSNEVLQVLRSAVDELGQTVVMVTHDLPSACIGDRIIVMRDGQIIADDEPTSIDTDILRFGRS